MDKIVVQYVAQDGIKEVLCLSATSAKSWLEGFAKAVLAAKNLETRESSAYDAWWAQRPEGGPNRNYQDTIEWMANKPKVEDHAGYFTYDGQQFDVSDFLEDGEVILPDAFGLEDWWKEHQLNG